MFGDEHPCVLTHFWDGIACSVCLNISKMMDAPRNPIWRGKIIGFWDSKWDNQKHVFIQCEAPKIAKLVYNSNKVVITIVTGAYKPTYILGPHIVANFRSDLHNQNIPLYQFSTPNAADRAGSIKCPTRGLFPCCIESVSMLTNQLPTVMIVQDMFEVTAPLELPHCCHFHTWAWCYVAYMGWGGHVNVHVKCIRCRCYVAYMGWGGHVHVHVKCIRCRCYVAYMGWVGAC